MSDIDPYGLFGMDDIWGAIYGVTGGWAPSQGLVDFGAGFGDSATFGITSRFRDVYKIGNVNKCSTNYMLGGLTASAVPLGYGLKHAKAVLPNFREWAKSPFWYEMGQKTVPTALYESLQLGSMTAAERGKAIVEKLGWIKAIFSLKGDWSKTLPTGPTPGGLLGVFGISAVTGGEAVVQNGNCDCQ